MSIMLGISCWQYDAYVVLDGNLLDEVDGNLLDKVDDNLLDELKRRL